MVRAPTLLRALVAMVVAVGSALALAAASPTRAAFAYASFKVLVFSKTTGFRHASAIALGIQAIRDLGAANNFAIDATDNDSLFSDVNLARYKTVVFLSTTGDPVGTQIEKDAFQRYIRNGGGFVGVHAAADSGYDWAWYGRLVGAHFKQHQAIRPARLVVEDSSHPSTRGLPPSFTRTDEWYEFQINPRGAVHVLISVDDGYPITWCHDFDGGRAFYTALGHTDASYSESNFLHLLLGGILSTANAVAADCSPPHP